ncbi:BNR-4 repeat-containing protein [Mangrovibacterium diazotrophicum]|uniref:Putative BNR repeat neuraminidase n=1 Tax=Mangrovibacterium diazotrophicum TaxID=1261403 RepID=A0A419W4F6_9BACT|nr:BNR-4 repeat-containing protein [Mangrovibacterium diazotrophicum]RKD90343.1 putative BNR repeat neuraminidase [Mangrovibacterium diazotrophicum]
MNLNIIKAAVGKEWFAWSISCLLCILFSTSSVFAVDKLNQPTAVEIINTKANGFRGIWYMNQPSNDEYVYKYSGGMATYTAKHQPIAIYAEEVNKTFFCYGATDQANSTLYHAVSYYDHTTGEVTNPTIILDKKTTDAHDNPVISIDEDGYIWVFSTSHGTSRPSYITKSVKPFSIDEFELVHAMEIKNGQRVPFDNFSYFQVWYVKRKGFIALYTKYGPTGDHVIGFNTSKNGVEWNEWQELAHIGAGHYAISNAVDGKIEITFNYHPAGKGLNYRTNLYYLETTDFGKHWTTVAGEPVSLPLTNPENDALIRYFAKDGLNCYLKDLNNDADGNPVILVISSGGFEAGPKNDPRTWRIIRWKEGWEEIAVTTSDNNYDMGSIYVEDNEVYRIIAPTTQGPQAYNPGGEITMWSSSVGSEEWSRTLLTSGSVKNHNYVRRPVFAQPDFYGIWADGNGRKPSTSSLYYCTMDGTVFQLPEYFTEETSFPVKITGAQ